jgi:hypothetical protein
MTVREMIEQVELEVKAAADHLDTEVTGGYSADLISTVMANAKEGNIWVTWHTHPNIVAAGLVVKLAAIVLVCGREPEDETIQKAEQEGVPVLVSKLPAFEIIGRLHDMGISGAQ